MATFQAQVHGLTSLTISSSGTSPTEAELTQFLTDGAKEIINQLPPDLLGLCSAQQTFTSVAPGSESETMNTGKILNVLRNDGDIDQPCRKISSTDKGRVLDSDDMLYASVTDPIYYTENNKINSLPSGGSCKYSEVQYPAVAYGDSAISVFPDEAEYLVPLYASVKSLQNVLGSKSSNSDITTALTAINTELDETQAVCDKIDDDLVLAKAEIVLAKTEADEIATQTDNSSTFNTAVAAIATELNRVDEIIDLANDEFDEVATQVSGSKNSPITYAFNEFEEARNLSGAYNSGVFATALGKIITSVENAEDEIEDGNKMLANIALGVAEVAESAVDTDTGNSEFKFAADAINTALDRIASYNWGDSDTFTSGSAQLTRVKNALDRAQDLIDGDAPSATTDAYGAQANEDVELVSSALNIAKTEVQRAQGHLSEWTALLQGATSEAQGFANEVQARGTWTSAKSQVWNGYFESAKIYAQAAQTYLASAQGYANEVQANVNTMQAFIATGSAYLQEAQSTIAAGDAYIKEAQSRIAQAQGYASEVNVRASFTSAKSQAVQGHISTAQSYVATAQGFSSEIQSKIQIAQGYGSEVQSRLSVDNAQYGWYEKQQAKLQADYDRGVQRLTGARA